MMTDLLDVSAEPPRVTARNGGEPRAVPALWLRERCHDPEHLDPVTQQRLFDPHQLPADLALTEARLDEDGANAWLAFSDGYAGWFDLGRLAADLGSRDGLPPKRAWKSDLNQANVRFDWRNLGEAADLRRAVGAFLEYGFIVLTDVPRDSERILEVARTFGNLRETNFGSYFEVYSRPQSNDLAYRPVALGPHTDNPYREPVPGVQLLHCLVNETTGGQSTLVDSIAAIEQIKAEDPEGFDLLATVPVRFRFLDTNEELVENRTVIQRDANGQVTGVHYSPRLDDLPLLDEATTQRFQRARQRLGELFVDPAYQLAFPLAAGELMMFDNSRVLHGRTSYDPTEGHRHLQGCYIDLDGPRSLYRTLSRPRAA